MNECVCEYCANIELKSSCLKASNSGISGSEVGNNFPQLTEVLESRYSLVKSTMCRKPEQQIYENRACIERKCTDCGSSMLKEKFLTLIEEAGIQNRNVTWMVWQLLSLPVSNKNGEVMKKMGLIAVSGTLSVLVATLCEELQEFSTHLFNAVWELRQFQNLSASVPENWLVTVLDFGQNYSCCYQDAVQVNYWHKEQVTVHPIVCYYTDVPLMGTK